jgi:hypothetical protein
MCSISVRIAFLYKSQLFLFVAKVIKEFFSFVATVVPFVVVFLKTKKFRNSTINSDCFVGLIPMTDKFQVCNSVQGVTLHCVNVRYSLLTHTAILAATCCQKYIHTQ